MTLRLNAPRRRTFIVALVLWIIGVCGTFLNLPFIGETAGNISLLAASAVLILGAILRNV